MQKLLRLSHWLKLRNASYIMIRLFVLLQRYGITSRKAKRRVSDCVQLLASYGCYPTFPTPGRVVRKNADFCRELQRMGAEIAVHGYDHVDFRSLSPSRAKAEFVRAARAFADTGIQIDGFRCPYLSYSEDLRPALPAHMFKYSSNKAIWWNVVSTNSNGRASAIFESLSRFYRASAAEATISLPSISEDLLEIPASLPDDIQLYDGLKLGDQGLTEAWTAMLRQIHRRGELFVLLFHPETYQHCKAALESVLREAQQLQPAVWLTQLRDVSAWWREKSAFEVSLTPGPAGVCMRFACSERATILIRNVKTDAPSCAWEGAYRVLKARSLLAIGDRWPLVGLAPTASPDTVAFLRDQGYLVDPSERAPSCAVYLDAATLASCHNQVQLIDHIEASPGALVRFWRWPGEAKSALCITGDLDALSLRDYIGRLFTL
jgi:peptidoglycan/xylan/chitin deacetylase (PgdA/CDA1 family)